MGTGGEVGPCLVQVHLRLVPGPWARCERASKLEAGDLRGRYTVVYHREVPEVRRIQPLQWGPVALWSSAWRYPEPIFSVDSSRAGLFPKTSATVEVSAATRCCFPHKAQHYHLKSNLPKGTVPTIRGPNTDPQLLEILL